MLANSIQYQYNKHKSGLFSVSCRSPRATNKTVSAITCLLICPGVGLYGFLAQDFFALGAVALQPFCPGGFGNFALSKNSPRQPGEC